MRRTCAFLLSCGLTASVALVAFGQAFSQTTVVAVSGKPLQLSYHANAHRKSCTPAALPNFRAVILPKEGSLTIRQGILTTDKILGCGSIKIPVLVVFYQSKDGFAGTDHAGYTVTNAEGEPQSFDVTIMVNAASPTDAPNKGSSL